MQQPNQMKIRITYRTWSLISLLCLFFLTSLYFLKKSYLASEQEKYLTAKIIHRALPKTTLSG